MSFKDPTEWGDFTLWGFTKDPQFLEQRVPGRLGINPQVIYSGATGCLFFYTSYGDVFESETAITLKLGLARSPALYPLSSRELSQREILRPDGIDSAQLSGPASVACLSKTAPQFVIYQTLLSASQLHYTTFDGSLLCADNLRTLIYLLDHVRVNEQAIPMHFLFRLIPGRLTYFEQIYSLCPGELLTWRDGNLQVKLVRDLPSLAMDIPTRQRDRNDGLLVFERLKQILETCVNDAPFANLLSGGVDSSVIQVALNELAKPTRSFSYSMLTPGFGAETDYADRARRSLRANHTVVPISPDDYLDLLVRTIETVFHPSLCVETDPCILALVEYMEANAPDIRLCFAGHGADALFGLGLARKLLLLDISRRIPGSRWLLLQASKLIQPYLSKKASGLREVADMLIGSQDPASFQNPVNMVAVYTDMEMARRCFGDQVLAGALEHRRRFAAQYLTSSSEMEQAHTINLLTWDYEAAVFGHQLFLAHRKEKRFPFLDQDMLGLAYSFDPRVRYIQGTTVKPLLKQLLIQKSLPAIAKNPKRGGTFEDDLFAWMKQGPLQERVQSIKRPSFMSQKDLQQLMDKPSPFLWELLILDIFQERIIDAHNGRVLNASS